MMISGMENDLFEYAGELAHAGNKEKHRYYKMDMEKAAQIYDYYYHQEPYIQICNDVKYAHVFKGGLSATWGNGRMHMKEFKVPQFQKELEAFLTKGLQYRDMFGLCPVKILGDNTDTILPYVIPQFGTGCFYIVLDVRTYQLEVLFIPYSVRQRGGFTTNMKHKKDPSTRVFVWPGLEPTLKGSQFKSKIFLLFEQYLSMTEFKKNALEADFETSHPTIFTQARPDTRSSEDLTETETFGDADSPILSLQEKQTYRRDVYRAQMMEQMTTFINAQARIQAQFGGSEVIDSTLKRKHIDEDTNRVTDVQRKSKLSSNFEPLPSGEEIARQIVPQTRKDLLELYSNYYDNVCLIMGIPRTYIAGKSKFKTDAEQERDIVKATVFKDRDAATLFFQYIYEETYRERDTTRLVNGILQLGEQKKQLERSRGKIKNASKHLATVKRRKSELKEIGMSQKRAELLFNEDPFMKNIDTNAVLVAADREAITAEEEINLLRSKLTLEKVDSTNELVKLREEQKKMKREEAQIRQTQLKTQPQEIQETQKSADAKSVREEKETQPKKKKMKIDHEKDDSEKSHSNE